jgi:hypothetical protein
LKTNNFNFGPTDSVNAVVVFDVAAVVLAFDAIVVVTFDIIVVEYYCYCCSVNRIFLFKMFFVEVESHYYVFSISP